MKNRCFVIAILMMGVAGRSGIAQAKGSEPFRNPKLPVPERVADLLRRMTLEEKVAQLESGVNWAPVEGHPIPILIQNDHLSEELAPRALANGLGTYAFLDEFNGRAGNARSGAENRNQIQNWVLKNTRLGIPVLFHGEALHGAVIKGATSFPQAVGLGSTWDPELIEQVFTTVAHEERALGNVLILAPVFDLSRDPRFGRVEEMYSEDPYLVAQMGTAAVRGLQARPSTSGEGRSLLTMSLPPPSIFSTASRKMEQTAVPVIFPSTRCGACFSTRFSRQ